MLALANIKSLKSGLSFLLMEILVIGMLVMCLNPLNQVFAEQSSALEFHQPYFFLFVKF